MTQSRGSDKVNVLQISRVGTKMVWAKDIEPILKIYFNDIEPLLEETFYKDIATKIVSQQAKTDFGTFVFRTKDEHNKAKNKVVRAAKTLRAKISELISLPDRIGLETLEPWQLDFRTANDEPLELLQHMLFALENFDENYFYKSNISQMFRGFIKDLSEIFESNQMPVTVHTNSEFFVFLIELERIFPSMVFPSETSSSGRIDYVREALGRRNRS